MRAVRLAFGLLVLLATVTFVGTSQEPDRPRLRDLGIQIGIFQTGTLNAITDVEDVRVGQVTRFEGDSVRTGVTAIVPHGGNMFLEKVPAAVFVGNGFGKLLGVTQIDELGQLETPILLTNTLSVWDAADGIVDYMLALPGMERVRSINPVVGETNDGTLNDIRGRHVTREDAIAAIKAATVGPVQEGTVGAGTGTVCFGWKGGIGTSSRILPASLGGYTLGVLVQTNFGGILEIAGVPVGKELEQYSFRKETRSPGDGSCMVIVATDAPLDARQLKRLAKRSILGLGRTGSSMSNGSGDYVIALSTAAGVRLHAQNRDEEQVPHVSEESLSPLFQAAVESTEEAVINSLLRAKSVLGMHGTRVEALPVDKVVQLLKKYGKIR